MGRKWVDLGCDVFYRWMCPNCRNATGCTHDTDFNEHKIRCDCGFIPHEIHDMKRGEICPECLQAEIDRSRELLAILREALNHVLGSREGVLVLQKYDERAREE